MVLNEHSSWQAAGAIATIVITGCSGSGKSSALKAFEDRGFYCVENLPIFLLGDLVSGLAARTDDNLRGLAVVTDSRDPSFPQSHEDFFAGWRAAGQPLTILFLEAAAEVLLRRYSQMRRVHPLAAGRPLREALRLEWEQLANLRQMADQVIDTSSLTPHELRRLLDRIATRGGEPDLQISFISFGYKYGPPQEADLVFDVRFLPNPYFVPALSGGTGLDAEVARYVLQHEDSRRFLELVRPLLAFLIPQYRREGKAYLTVGVGCTGGRHRSVAMAEELARGLQQAGGDGVLVSHRDLDRG